MNGSVLDYSHAREGANVSYQCDEGYTPSGIIMATCTNTSKWIPAQECTLFIPGK